MKYNRFMWILVLFVVAAAMLIAGCEGDSESGEVSVEPDALIGTWSLTRMSLSPSGVSMTVAQILAIFSATGSVTVQFNADNTVTASAEGTAEGESVNETGTGTWSAGGGQLTVTSEGITQTVEYSVSGDELTVTIPNAMLQQLVDTELSDQDESTLAAINSLISGQDAVFQFTAM